MDKVIKDGEVIVDAIDPVTGEETQVIVQEDACQHVYEAHGKLQFPLVGQSVAELPWGGATVDVLQCKCGAYDPKSQEVINEWNTLRMRSLYTRRLISDLESTQGAWVDEGLRKRLVGALSDVSRYKRDEQEQAGHEPAAGDALDAWAKSLFERARPTTARPDPTRHPSDVGQLRYPGNVHEVPASAPAPAATPPKRGLLDAIINGVAAGLEDLAERQRGERDASATEARARAHASRVLLSSSGRILIQPGGRYNERLLESIVIEAFMRGAAHATEVAVELMRAGAQGL